MKKDNTIYSIDGIPSLGTAIPLGLQHVLAMFAGNVTPLIIIANALGLPIEERTFLIQAAMFVAGITTLIQLYPIGPIGAKLPIVQGTSFGFLPTCLAISAKYGLAGVLGASFIGGFVEIFLGVFLKPLRKYFPPVVTGTVLLSIGLSLLPTGIRYFAGGVGTPDFGSFSNLLLGTIVLATILFFKQFTKGITSMSAILIGLLVGYAVAIPMGKVNFEVVGAAGWVAFPTPLKYGMTFHMDAIIAMLLMYIVTAVETVGDISGITIGGANREATDKELAGGVMADGLGSSIAAIFNVLPTTSFSQNVGIVALTGIMNRFVVAVGAVFLIAAGLFPKVGAVVAIMPQSVLGGAAIVMFSMIAISGINLITKDSLKGKNSITVAVAMGLGFGLGSVPEALVNLPEAMKLIFGGSGIVVTGLIAIFLNIILPEDQEETTIVLQKKVA
ncbi:uracil-xanthine permease family protein [Natronincola ferrireducens]|uniref:Nucleobase:cation symporter-2, NCS2 family n=1 Tax=Natronincola ferrireducens TaxID=393762 RepID=A0A1G9GUT4_9FIRM|nr:nucleobase:cation symporter-2 family protein [Natronincola ferrireducens]SDL04033.1 nucleobase:cation symporter-2, NCS2 family [Natronincola ferrireducens]